MLQFLRIHRLAVIDAVEVDFGPGFNVLTGETGAGKSILIEAVGLLLGGRASGDLVRTGAKSADDLKACTDSARAVQNQAIDVLNARQAGNDVNPQIDALNAAIDQNESLCNASSDSYQQFIDALDKVKNQ